MDAKYVNLSSYCDSTARPLIMYLNHYTCYFYLDVFYNQFSLRIISKFFWRGTVSYLMSVHRVFVESSAFIFSQILVESSA